MITVKGQKGQTLIETAFILILLMLILLGIAEFARAWYMNNSLKNAVRQGVRKAVVSPNITPTVSSPPPPIGTYTDCTGAACPTGSTIDNTYILNSVCCSPGVQNRGFSNINGGTRVSITYTDDNGSPGLNAGDTILVYAQTSYKSVVPLLSPYLGNRTMTTAASMRYE